MENEQRILQLLEQLEKSNQKKVLYARLQFIFTVVAAICCVVLMVSGMNVLPLLEEAAGQAEIVLDNLETVTSQLAEADLSGMVENVDSLVSTSQVGVEQTIEKLNEIDFEALNKAIKDLSDVIEPIARFFKTFR